MASPIALPGASGAIVVSSSGPVTFFGFTCRETAAGSAVFRLRDGTVTGTILEVVSLASGESSGDWYGPQGLVVSSGSIYYQLVSGAVEGSVRCG